MLSKLQAFRHIPIQKLNARQLRKLFLNPLCTVIESPELPSWAKLGAANEIEDDDFVIPSLANWVESHKLGGPIKAVKDVPISSEAGEEEEESEADKISLVLRQSKYASPVDAAIALDRRGSELSPFGSIEMVLKRFSNDWVPAFGVFEWAKTRKGYDHTPELYDSMVDTLGKCKRFEVMWELVEEMRGFVSLNTMTRVMRRLAKARRFDEAVEAFRGIERFGVSKDVFALNALLDALNKENGGEHAVGVFLEYKELIPPNERTFNIMIHGSCIARRFDDARKMMEEMERNGFEPDVFSYTCFVEAHVRERDFRRASAVRDEMRERGLRPSVVTYTIVMHGLGKAKQIDAALKVYEEAKESGFVPDAGFYNSVIFMLGKSGRIRDARDVFDDMTRQWVLPDRKTYTSLITCFCEHSMEESALTLLKKMEENKCEPDVDTYSPLLKMCCKKKRMKVLYFLLDHMFSNGVCVTAGTYSLLITGLCKSGKLEEACRFFEEMVSKGMVPLNHPYQRLKRELQAAEMVTGKPKKVYYKKFWPVNQGRDKGKNLRS